MTGEEIDLVVRRLIALEAPKAPLLEIYLEYNTTCPTGV